MSSLPKQKLDPACVTNLWSLIRDIIARMRHDGCGGRAGRVELLTGTEGANSRPVRRIVLMG